MYLARNVPIMGNKYPERCEPFPNVIYLSCNIPFFYVYLKYGVQCFPISIKLKILQNGINKLNRVRFHNILYVTFVT